MILAPLLALALGSTPQLPPIPRADCSVGLARWSAADERGGFDDLPPVPRNTATAIWSCSLGGRLLVVKSLLQMPDTGGCEVADGEVSAWVDGVKLIDREETGERMQCNASSKAPAGRLAWLQLTAAGALEVCRDRIVDFGEGWRSCRRMAVGGRRDPAYLPPEFRTRPGVLPRSGDPAFCGPLTARLLPDDAQGHDRSLEDAAAPGTEAWADSSLYFGDGDQIVFDIDNDGRPDRVERRPELKLHGPVAKLFWRPLDGDPVGAWSAPDLAPAEVGDEYKASGYRPVRLGGRAYLYVRDRPVTEGRFDAEAIEGALNISGTTRVLLALSPDGSSRTVCAWGPRPRPEEFL